MSVIEIGALRIQRERFPAINGKAVCQHKSLTLNREGHVIRCADCGAQVEPFWAFEQLVDSYSEAWKRLQQHTQRHNAEMERGLTLKAARHVEDAWRSRTMAPVCPHCREAIFPQDGFGSNLVNRELALRRRQVAAEKKEGAA